MCRLFSIREIRHIKTNLIAAAVAVLGIFVLVSTASAQTLQSTYQVDPNTGQGPVTTQSPFDITNNQSMLINDTNGNLLFSKITQNVAFGGIKASSQSFVVTSPSGIATSSFALSTGQFSDMLTVKSLNNPVGAPAQIAISVFLDGTLTSNGTLPNQTGNLDYAQATVSAGFAVPFCSGFCQLLSGQTSTMGIAVGGNVTPPATFFGTALNINVGETFEHRPSLRATIAEQSSGVQREHA